MQRIEINSLIDSLIISLLLFIITFSVSCNNFRETINSQKAGTVTTVIQKKNEVSLNQKRSIPTGLVGIYLSNEDGVCAVDIPYRKAIEIKTKVDEDFKSNYTKPGHRRWFFVEFDKDTMIFWVARYKPNPIKGKRSWGTYIAEGIYRVKRSEEAENELAIKERIQLYENGKHEIKAGMTESEVIKILGQPKEIRQLGPVGSFDFIYDQVTVRFLNYDVAEIWE